jgi:hypothetical protein
VRALEEGLAGRLEAEPHAVGGDAQMTPEDVAQERARHREPVALALADESIGARALVVREERSQARTRSAAGIERGAPYLHVSGPQPHFTRQRGHGATVTH